jgi:MFS family permease
MYTLEDDQETSSRLNKRDIAEAKPQAGTFGDGGEVEVSDNGKHVALAALTIACIGVFLTALDQTVVVTALPQIIVDLHIPFTQLDHASWIISAYLLGFIVAMPLMGRVSDIYGRRRIFLLCLLIFGVGSAFCGLAPFFGDNVDLSFLSALDAIHLHIDTSSPGLIWLIAARLFQAIGGGAVVPVAMAIAGDFYGQGRRGLALGIIGAVTEAGGVLGPLYGALIVQHFGWQYIFYLNVPLVGALMIAAWICIPKGTRLQEGIDWIGAILLGIALTCLSLGLAQQGTELGPTTANSAATQNNPIALVLAGVFLIAFVLVERKVRWPVVQLSLFRRFPFSATSLVSLLVGAALIIAMADIPIFVDTILQLPVLDSGLALLRLTAMIPFGALLGGWLCSRISCRFTGVLGLLFTAAGFYLMSRWPIHVDWTQITISTVTAGLGFGLVIAPIGTTAINAVKATQAGMGSASVTSLRIVGMMLGLAALTSWALAYFKQLVSTYPSLPTTATAAQFAAWSKGYAAHIISSAHTVYSAVFFATMILCLIAILPAIFLWGNKAPEAEEIEVAPASPVLPPEPDPALHEAVTLPVADVSESTLPTGSLVPLPEEPPIPPIEDTSGNNDKGGRNPKRRRLLIIASIALIFLMIAGGVLAAFLLQPNDNGPAPTADTTPGPNPTNTPTLTPIAGPRMFQLALDKGALTSIFVSQLNLQQGALTDLSVVPLPNDVLVLSLNLHIDADGIHRVMPIELDGVISTDKQQNLSLHVTHLLRDGQDAGPTAAAHMQTAMNQLLLTSVMPALRGQLKGVKLISAHTSKTIACSKGAEMLVLLIEAPPIEGIAAQPTPVPFCFSGPIDLNKLLPH